MQITAGPSPTLASLLATQNCSALARELKRTRATVAGWRRGESVPSARDLPQLATLLRVDLAELTRIVAADAERIERNRTAA